MTDENIFVITGATSGIGKVAAAEIAGTGARVILTARDLVKGESVKQEIIKVSRNEKVDVMECDLSSMSSIRNFVTHFGGKNGRLDVLVNNAGTWENKRSETSDGFEKMFAVNYLAPFLLTELMIPFFDQSRRSRIIFVSSNAYGMGRINFKDLQVKEKFSSFRAYAQSKLAVMLAAGKFASVLGNPGIVVNCMHPGFVATNLFRSMKPWMNRLIRKMAISPEKGAKTLIYLALSHEAGKISGRYFVREKPVNPMLKARNTENMEKLWTLTREMLNI